jgi:hypothetical protein
MSYRDRASLSLLIPLLALLSSISKINVCGQRNTLKGGISVFGEIGGWLNEKHQFGVVNFRINGGVIGDTNLKSKVIVLVGRGFDGLLSILWQDRRLSVQCPALTRKEYYSPLHFIWFSPEFFSQGFAFVPSHVVLDKKRVIHHSCGGGMPYIGERNTRVIEKRVAYGSQVVGTNICGGNPGTLRGDKFESGCLSLRGSRISRPLSESEADEEYDKADNADYCGHDSDSVKVASNAKMRIAIPFLFGIALIFLGAFFDNYGERTGDLKHELMWWAGYFLMVLGGVLVLAALLPSLTHWLILVLGNA